MSSEFVSEEAVEFLFTVDMGSPSGYLYTEIICKKFYTKIVTTRELKVFFSEVTSFNTEIIYGNYLQEVLHKDCYEEGIKGFFLWLHLSIQKTTNGVI